MSTYAGGSWSHGPVCVSRYFFFLFFAKGLANCHLMTNISPNVKSCCRAFWPQVSWFARKCFKVHQSNNWNELSEARLTGRDGVPRRSWDAQVSGSAARARQCAAAVNATRGQIVCLAQSLRSPSASSAPFGPLRRPSADSDPLPIALPNSRGVRHSNLINIFSQEVRSQKSPV